MRVQRIRIGKPPVLLTLTQCVCVLQAGDEIGANLMDINQFDKLVGVNVNLTYKLMIRGCQKSLILVVLATN